MLASGCQYAFPVRAERQGDHVLLTARDHGGHFVPHACVRVLEVQEVAAEGGRRTIWRIEHPGRGWPVEGGTCERTDFPIVYGAAPEGYRTVVPAEPLRPDGRYVVVGAGVARYYGAFRLRADLDVEPMKVPPGAAPPLTSH